MEEEEKERWGEGGGIGRVVEEEEKERRHSNALVPLLVRRGTSERCCRLRKGSSSGWRNGLLLDCKRRGGKKIRGKSQSRGREREARRKERTPSDLIEHRKERERGSASDAIAKKKTFQVRT